MVDRTAALRVWARGYGVVASCLLFLLPGPLVSGCRTRPEAELAATYEGGQITRDEYQSWLAYAKLDDDPLQRAARLGRIALGRVLSAELIARGGDREPAVAGKLADLEDGVLSQALERRVLPEARVSDAEVEQALRENEADRHQPRRFQLANLFKRVPPDASPAQRRATRARMEELRGQILAGADFSELARRESDSQTRFRGGRMGVAGPGQLPPELEKVAFQLGEGEVSRVLEHPQGFTLLKCLRILPERTMPVEEARQKLRQHLESKTGTRRFEEVVSAALARWPLVVEMSADAIRSAEPSRVVARFGERAVTRADLGHWLGGGVERLGSEELGDGALRAFLQDRARLHAAAKRARELGLESVPEVAAQLAWGRLKILATEAMARRVRDAFQEPTEEELRAHFESSRDRRVQPASFRVSVLRFGWGDQPLPARSHRAEEVLARVRAGRLTFERAARELSTHASSSRGGDLGWLTSRGLAGLGPSVVATIKDLEVGDVSPPVLQDGAPWALLLTGRDKERPQTFEEARQDLRRELGNEQTQALQKRIEDRMLAELHLHLR